MTTLYNLNDLADYFDAEGDTPEQLQQAAAHRLYKDTACGAWITFQTGGVTLGSIVEGSDAEVRADPLTYPFTDTELQNTINWVEREVHHHWLEANTDGAAAFSEH